MEGRGSHAPLRAETGATEGVMGRERLEARRTEARPQWQRTKSLVDFTTGLTPFSLISHTHLHVLYVTLPTSGINNYVLSISRITAQPGTTRRATPLRSVFCAEEPFHHCPGH